MTRSRRLKNSSASTRFSRPCLFCSLQTARCCVPVLRTARRSTASSRGVVVYLSISCAHTFFPPQPRYRCTHGQRERRSHRRKEAPERSGEGERRNRASMGPCPSVLTCLVVTRLQPLSAPEAFSGDAASLVRFGPRRSGAKQLSMLGWNLPSSAPVLSPTDLSPPATRMATASVYLGI